MRFIERIQQGSPASPDRLLSGLPSPSRMAERLRSERAISDRCGEALSVVVFDAGDPAIDPAPASCLVMALRRRLRASDEFGWVDATRIAVLLPSTPYDGACALVRDVRRAAAPGWSQLDVRIYTHRCAGDGDGWGPPAVGRMRPA